MRVREVGFTLVELMIAVAIIAILASIAYPSYTRYVQEARRTEAQATLMELAGRLERCYTVSNDYSTCGISFPVTSEDGFYVIDAPKTELSASTYKLIATPQGAQAPDPVCTSFTLNHQGTRGYTGSGSKNDCW